MKRSSTLFICAVLAALCLQPVQGRDSTWQPLFNGSDFSGWHVIGKGEWLVRNGAIHGRMKRSEPAYGHLVTDREYADFVVRLKFRALQGNSGLYFRIDETGFSGVSGIQAEIDARVDVGGLYETNGRKWIVQPSADQVAAWFHPLEWNELEVSAQGGHVVVRINGKVSAEVVNDTGRRTGRLALQIHGGKDCDVWFKDIAIRTLKQDSQP